MKNPGASLMLLLIVVLAAAGERRTVAIPSRCMDRHLNACIVLPTPRDDSLARFPVIYALHGFGGNQDSWPSFAPLERFADEGRVIFVCPAAQNSWYIDSPVDTNSRFETFIARETVEWADRHLPTIAARNARALMGMSMGGHGALTLLARHQETFCAVGSIAGIMDLTAFPREWEMDRVLGPCRKNTARWVAAGVLAHLPLLKDRDSMIIIHCGTNDFALPGNRRAHDLLKRRGIGHTYRELPGGHDARFVREVAEEQVAFLIAALVKKNGR